MKIKNEFKAISNLEVWNMVIAYVDKHKQFMSTTGIEYNATATNESIDYKGGKTRRKRATEGESISKQLFISAYSQVRFIECVNTISVKPYIDRKQTPFVGLLKTAGIIE